MSTYRNATKTHTLMTTVNLTFACSSHVTFQLRGKNIS